MDLSTENPLFTATKDCRVKARDLFEGSDTVKDKTTTYLYQETNESDDDYDIRIQRAVFDPYVEKIINARQALLFRKPHKREVPANLKEFVQDVDRNGTPADVFFADCARDAQIDGIHWVAVDMPTAPEQGYPSAAAERSAGVRPFFEHVPAACVLDWAIADDQELLWAVIQQQSPDRRGLDQWGEANSPVDQWKIWTRDHWYLYQLKSDTAAGGTSAGVNPLTTSNYQPVAEGPNTSGVVPLIPFYGIKHADGDYAGWPVARGILDHVVLLYNLMSDLDWFERLTAHPIPYCISPKKPERLHVAKGLWVESQAGGGSIQIGYLEPTGSSYEAIRDTIRELKTAIYSISLAQAQRDSAQIQSADAQREDRRIFASSLASCSAAFEAAEFRCWQTMAKWLGTDDSGIEIAYNRDFDDALIAETMIGAMNDLADSGRLTTRTLLETMKRGELLPDEFDVDKELKALEEEETKSTAATLRAMRAVPLSPTEGVTSGQATGQPMTPAPNVGA